MKSAIIGALFRAAYLKCYRKPLDSPYKEADMFARNVSVNLRPDTLSAFLKTMENEIVPLLRKQKGFQDEMTLSFPGGIEVAAVSFWDRKENAQSYDSSGYPKVLKILDKFLDRTPDVRTFEVVGSTFQKRAGRAASGTSPRREGCQNF